MTTNQERAQLTLDVGLEKEPPAGSTFRLQGEISSLERELRIDDVVQVLVMGIDGEILLSKYACCVGVSFIKHRPENGPDWVERAHKLKIVDAVS